MPEEATNPAPPSVVECAAAKDPAVRLFIVTAVFAGWGVYCYIDHYVKGLFPYPDSSDLNKWASYLVNHYSPWICGPLALAALARGIVFLGRKLRADDAGIGYVGKAQIPWSAIKSLDTSKAKQGLIRLHYDAGGVPRTLVLDSWKLRHFRDLVLLVERKTTSVPRKP